ncbi:MAG: DsbA family protein [Pseudolabrys sp.]
MAAALGPTVLPVFPAQAQEAQGSVPLTELMAPQALPDLWLGDPKAPVIIIEYASMTCPHCAHFDETTFPALKKQYIDTGKVRYTMREFPLDPLAAAAFMLARCAADMGPDGKDTDAEKGKNKDKYYAMIDTLFRKQDEWVKQKPLPDLLSISKQAGFSKESFDACLKNQKLLDDIQKERQVAIDKFKVHSTPTFFINGKAFAGAMTIEQMAKLIDPDLKGK